MRILEQGAFSALSAIVRVVCLSEDIEVLRKIDLGNYQSKEAIFVDVSPAPGFGRRGRKWDCGE
jgi:hypothetical protein